MKTKKSEFFKDKLTSTELSAVYGGKANGDPCCTFTAFNDGTWSDSDEDCEAQPIRG